MAHFVIRNDLVMTHLMSVEELTDNSNDQTDNKSQPTTLVTLEVTPLVEIDFQKLDIFWHVTCC